MLLSQSQNVVTVQAHIFFINNHSYKYVGANYWFGGLLGVNKKGKRRLKKVLNFLVAHGVTNLRVLAVAEGEGQGED